jgi:hypothetical protein
MEKNQVLPREACMVMLNNAVSSIVTILVYIMLECLTVWETVTNKIDM